MSFSHGSAKKNSNRVALILSELEESDNIPNVFHFQMKRSCFMTEEYIAQTTEVHDTIKLNQFYQFENLVRKLFDENYVFSLHLK